MKTFYQFELASGAYAVANLDRPGPGILFPGWSINRINVPKNFRGQGHGTRLLQMVLDDADQEGVSLHLWIYPSGPLDRDALMRWYVRHGFLSADREGTMWRPARVLAKEEQQ